MTNIDSVQMLSEFAKVDKKQLFRFYKSLSEKPFVLTDTGISTRTFQHWKTFDLIPQVQEDAKGDKKREWVRLNFNDYLWLKTIDTLRNFGYPFEHIKSAKDALFKASHIDKAKETLRQNPQFLNKLIENSLKDSMPNETKEALKGLMTEDFMSRFQGILSQQMDLTTLWSMLIFESIQNKKNEYGLFFLEDGTCLPFQGDAFYGSGMLDLKRADVQRLFRTPHIYISITNLIVEFISDEEKADYVFDLSLVNEQEHDLLRKFRSNEYKKITISYDKGQNSKIIKTEKEKKVKKENIADFVENVLRNPYNKVSLTSTKKGELIVNVEKTKKL
jgi:DNA-binding transcriptional MerR regulator